VLPVFYSMTVSLGGFTAGPNGDIRWTAPDAELFRFHIEQTGHIAAHLCGRGLYQAMLVWETAEQTMSDEAEREFARIWRPIPKVMFSRTLDSVVGNARPATGDIATEVARFRDQPGEGMVSIGPIIPGLIIFSGPIMVPGMLVRGDVDDGARRCVHITRRRRSEYRQRSNAEVLCAVRQEEPALVASVVVAAPRGGIPSAPLDRCRQGSGWSCPTQRTSSCRSQAGIANPSS
jgi:hypothetical protein